MGLNFEIRQLGESDVDPYEDHMERLSRESGDGVTPIFMVLQKGVFKRKPDEIRKLWAENIKKLGMPGPLLVPEEILNGAAKLG